MSEVLATNNLQFAYNKEVSFKFPDLLVQQGEQWLILGHSGCGKSTLLHLLAGLRKPASGEIRYKGESARSIRNMDRYRGQHIGIVFQEPHFVKTLSIRQNLALASWCPGLPSSAARIAELSEALQISHRIDALPSKLSQGEKQRASIARALVNKPQIVLADEPTSALDDDNCARVSGLLQEVTAKSEACLVVVTHDSRLKTQIENQLQL